MNNLKFYTIMNIEETME